MPGPKQEPRGVEKQTTLPHVTYISEKVGHSDLVFRWWCGGDKRYLLVKFDGPAMHGSGQTGFVLQTASQRARRRLKDVLHRRLEMV